MSHVLIAYVHFSNSDQSKETFPKTEQIQHSTSQCRNAIELNKAHPITYPIAYVCYAYLLSKEFMKTEHSFPFLCECHS